MGPEVRLGPREGAAGARRRLRRAQDDLAVFDRPLTDAEVDRVYGLKNGIRDLRPKK